MEMFLKYCIKLNVRLDVKICVHLQTCMPIRDTKFQQ